MVTAEARDGVDTKMLEVGLRNGAAAREPAVPNSRDSRWFQWLKKGGIPMWNFWVRLMSFRLFGHHGKILSLEKSWSG
jgi:hypothetical protein